MPDKINPDRPIYSLSGNPAASQAQAELHLLLQDYEACLDDRGYGKFTDFYFAGYPPKVPENMRKP